MCRNSQPSTLPKAVSLAMFLGTICCQTAGNLGRLMGCQGLGISTTVPFHTHHPCGLVLLASPVHSPYIYLDVRTRGSDDNLQDSRTAVTLLAEKGVGGLERSYSPPTEGKRKGGICNLGSFLFFHLSPPSPHFRHKRPDRCK